MFAAIQCSIFNLRLRNFLPFVKPGISSYYTTEPYPDTNQSRTHHHGHSFKFRFNIILPSSHGYITCGSVLIPSTVWITSIYQPRNAHIISHKTLLKHFKTLRHVSILSDHHQGALFLAKVVLQYSQFNSYLETRCCGSISCVEVCCGAVARCAE